MRVLSFFKDFEYQLIRENVNMLKLIQIGITLSNEKGEVPKENLTWQFNFKFDLKYEKNNCKKMCFFFKKINKKYIVKMTIFQRQSVY